MLITRSAIDLMAGAQLCRVLGVFNVGARGGGVVASLTAIGGHHTLTPSISTSFG
jgi:hypothetical protein